jgi:hypothetical protein
MQILYRGCLNTIKYDGRIYDLFFVGIKPFLNICVYNSRSKKATKLRLTNSKKKGGEYS